MTTPRFFQVCGEQSLSILYMALSIWQCRLCENVFTQAASVFMEVYGSRAFLVSNWTTPSEHPQEPQSTNVKVITTFFVPIGQYMVIAIMLDYSITGV